MIIRLFMIFLCLFYTILMFLKIWQCTPIERHWKHSVDKSCVNISTLLNTSGVFNITSDVLILLVPIKSVWNLNMDRTRKIQILLVFTVGLMYVPLNPPLYQSQYFPWSFQLDDSPSILLTRHSAPVFSSVGFAIRIQISASLDVTYNQSKILLWVYVNHISH